MKKLFRWPAWAVLTMLTLTVLFSTSTLMFHAAPFSAAHAAEKIGNTSGPTLSMPDIIHPNDVVTITGQGFAVRDQVTLSIVVNSYSTFLGYMNCDGNGNCSDTLTIPDPNLTQGIYTISGTGKTGLTAQFSVTLLPSISSSLAYANEALTMAGPGTTLEVGGEAFNANETVNVYWGTTLEGTATSQYNGMLSFVFSVPDKAVPGSYTISATRTNQTPAKVSMNFTVLAPRMVSSAGIRNSQPVHVKLSGFQASENAIISWNANGGQTMTMLTVDATGAINSYFVPPFAPKGAYTLTATGASSGLKATSSLHIGPGILLEPNTANPGGTTVISGGGYTPGETVNIYFQTSANGTTAVSADSSGSFSVSLSIPATYKKSALYYIYAISAAGNNAAKAQFFYATPSISVTCGCYYGQSFTVTGQEFTARETVSVYRQYGGQQTPVLIGKVTAANDGSFTLNSTMTSAPYMNSGWPFSTNTSISAKGNRSKILVNELLYVRANVIPAPNAGQIGQKIRLNGGGFGSGETVTLSFQNHPLRTVVAAPNGGFSTTFIVPKGSVPSTYLNNLDAVGDTTSVAVDVSFGINPSMQISPTTGPSGTIITASGNGYYPSKLLDIDWYNPGTKTEKQLTSLQSTSSGTFSTTITAPANLISGTTYDVIVIDTAGETPLQAPFVAQ